MSDVLAEYRRLHDEVLGHFRAVDAVAVWLAVDPGTVHRVLERAQRVEERGQGRA